MMDIPCGLVVAAIGYRADPVPGLPYDEVKGIIPNDKGRIEKGLYAVGWIKRGRVLSIQQHKDLFQYDLYHLE